MKIRHLLTSALLLLLGAASTAAAESPKYIFYFIGDGMGAGPVMAAQTYLRMTAPEAGPLTMLSFPVASWASTYSASSPVTDSAAAGTALATGSKTRNGMLGMTPDSAAVTSIARRLKDAGYGVGLVTTVAADDATPAAFYAHVPHRSHFYDIGCQLAASGYDFVAGSGLRGHKDKEGKATDLASRLERAGVHTLRGRAGLDSVGILPAGERILLVNERGLPEWTVGYTIDSLASALDLPSMTRAAIARLSAVSPERFFLMVEGGNIDHALHANDAGTAVKEVLAFDEALAAARDFYLAHPEETLIVVTADHDTGGMAMGSNALPYDARPANFDAQRMSKERFNDHLKALRADGRDMSWEQMRAFLAEHVGLFGAVAVDAATEERLQKLYTESSGKEEHTLYADFNAFAAEVYRLMAATAGFGFTTTHHSGNPVGVYATGAGAEAFSRFNDNTDLPRLIMR